MPIVPMVPVFLLVPSAEVYSPPMACALSSITARLYFFAMVIISSIGAAWPYRCTGTMALVFGVIAFSSEAGSMQKVFASTSEKTGVSLSKAAASVVAIKVKEGVITSSPG